MKKFMDPRTTKNDGIFRLRDIFKPRYQLAFSPDCSPYISHGISCKNLIRHQDVSSPLIISFISMI